MANQSRPRILIIDDMAINQVILSSQLGALQVETDCASSGEKGLELFRDNEYDLVLVDLHMPDMDGYATLAQLQTIFGEKGRKVPVICETADDAPEIADSLKEAGFAEVLVKPIDFGELHDMMVRCLGAKYIGTKEPTEATAEEIEAAYAELPEWVKTLPGLDARYGLARCGGSAEDYLDALAIFAASIDEKAKNVRHYLEMGDDKINVLRLHSLKSSARLVGAVTLAEQAAALEMAGKVGNHASLESGVGALIAHYRQIEEPLKEHLGTRSGTGALPPISDETLADTYDALYEAVYAKDDKNITTLLGALGEYDLGSKEAVRLEKLKIAERKKDYDAMRAIVEEAE